MSKNQTSSEGQNETEVPMLLSSTDDETMEGSGADAEKQKLKKKKKGKRKLRSPKKEKEVDNRLTSKVYDSMIRFKDGEAMKGKCKYCGKIYAADPKLNGTSTMRYHIRTCKLNPDNVDKLNKLNYKPAGKGNKDDSVIWRFDQNGIRKALTVMIVVDELPFSFVEKEGFKQFMEIACPRFDIPSRHTIARDCLKLFIDAKKNLSSFFKMSSGRVCWTTDTWTSIQKVNFMCHTAHFIDGDWNLHKKIINFTPISSHRGDDIGLLIEKCLIGWDISKLMTITVDNASSNDTAIAYMREKSLDELSKSLILGGKFLHMRCIAHIINLAVQDGLKDLDESISRVRASVKYVKNSGARLKCFKECAKLEGITSKCFVGLDVSTRWNSTYIMLSSALKFEKAFRRYAFTDPMFVLDLNGGVGVPSSDDWEKVRIFSQFLEFFYHLTNRISGSLYVTSNNYYNEIVEVYVNLDDWQKCGNPKLRTMASVMKTKFEKYWGNIEKMNMLIYIANVLDPRFKMQFLESTLPRVYDTTKAKKELDLIKKDLEELFAFFKDSCEKGDESLNNGTSESGVQSGGQSSGGGGESRGKSIEGSEERQPHSRRVVMDFFMTESEGADGTKSEIERYLDEKREVNNVTFDILLWWKVNSPRFPILSQMARSVLGIPISTVASESAFSTGGRVLDPFRSSLTPRVVEALICGQDWLRS